MERSCPAVICPRGAHLTQVPPEHSDKEDTESAPPDMTPQGLGDQGQRCPTLHPQTRQCGLLRDKWLPLAPTPQPPQEPEDTHPLRQRTALCPHTPPSLPSKPSSSAAGSATPAPQDCRTVRGASAGRAGLGQSCGPSLAGPRRPDGSAGHH